MRRTASEVIRDLEIRVARLENKTAAAAMPMIRRASRFDSYVMRGIADQVSDMYDEELGRQFTLSVLDEGEGNRGKKYYLVDIDGAGYYAIISESRGDQEIEDIFEDSRDAKNAFRKLAR